MYLNGKINTNTEKISLFSEQTISMTQQPQQINIAYSTKLVQFSLAHFIPLTTYFEVCHANCHLKITHGWPFTMLIGT